MSINICTLYIQYPIHISMNKTVALFVEHFVQKSTSQTYIWFVFYLFFSFIFPQ